MPLGIDFSWILMDFGTQLGSQSSPRTHLHRFKIETQLQHCFGSVSGASWDENTLKKKTFLDMGTGSAMKLTSFKQNLQLQTNKNKY